MGKKITTMQKTSRQIFLFSSKTAILNHFASLHINCTELKSKQVNKFFSWFCWQYPLINYFECDQEFNATMYFVQHYKYVHGGIPPGFEDKEKFMCDQCPSVFFNNLSLKLHYKTKHSDIIKDPAKVGRRNCPHCEKTFATYLSYKEHIKVRIMSFQQGFDCWN